MEGDALKVINPQYYNKIKNLDNLLNAKGELNEEQGWWGMDPNYVQKNK